MLDVWPLLPISVHAEEFEFERWGADNIVAVLERNDRICQLVLKFPGLHFEELLAAMQRPFQALTYLDLELQPGGEPVPVVPASFLGGSASSLRELHLNHIPFPGLPKLHTKSQDMQ
jgi:hypothetical protein